MKGLKFYIKNEKGTIYRIDNLKWLEGHIPSQIDLVRRYLFCKMANKPYQPYMAMLERDLYDKFVHHIGGCKSSKGTGIYGVFDVNNVKLFEICRK